MADLLIELFSEEIPARMQRKAREAFQGLVLAGLKEAGLSHGAVESHVTPRRLVLAVADLPEKQPDVREERKGPKVGAPEKALNGFLASVGLTLDQVETRSTPKGDVYFAVMEKPGRPTREVLPELIYNAIVALPWPKSMRWSTGRMAYVRPLHSIIALFGGTPLVGGLSMGQMASQGQEIPVAFVADPASDASCLAYGAQTRGHRFLAPEPIQVSDFASYKASLRAAKVMVDAEERKTLILEGARRLASENGLTLNEDPGLLEEVAGLVEWPVPLMGRIDDAFMEVPQEVLITSMKTHQKYFSLSQADGSLAPNFVVIANMETGDGGAQIVAGNERVLRARLSDAKYFWDQDRAKALADRVPALGSRVFHAELGTDLQKVERMRGLARWLAEQVPGADPDKADRAALLAKADLTTEMVGEFPELQGLMGRYYALLDGEDAAVADALRDHYAPLGPSDACPQELTAICVALADKLDTLAGFWVIDSKPTGSKDPFSLRRAALGVIRLILENGLRLSLRATIEAARGPVSAAAAECGLAGAMDKAITDDLMAFLAERLKVQSKEKGIRHDLIAAVFALSGEDDLVRLLARVEALAGFLGSEDGANLLAAHKRAANIVRIEEKKDKSKYDGEPDPALLAQDEEKALWEALSSLAGPVGDRVGQEDFTGAMEALAALRGPVDAFLDKVTVNAEDPALRANRLRLLSGIGAAMGLVADFSCIEG
ncbi:MAG: glycine--tRNA ligase subunit beta [Rhodospirillaceae bacterium]